MTTELVLSICVDFHEKIYKLLNQDAFIEKQNDLRYDVLFTEKVSLCLKHKKWSKENKRHLKGKQDYFY